MDAAGGVCPRRGGENGSKMIGTKTLAVMVLAASAATAIPDAPAATATPLPIQLVWIAEGLAADIVLQAGQPLTDGTTFAGENDLTSYFSTDDQGHGILLVGHELRYKSQPDGLGGRFTRLRLDGTRVSRSETWVGGMHFNCAGTATPWRTVLSGEENPHDFLPRVEGGRGPRMELTDRVTPGDPAARVGWMYEIDPLATDKTRRAKRRVALGRFSHESAAVWNDREVFMTEDAYQGHFFKFVADHPKDLSRGKLFAYKAATRSWLPIKDVYNARPEADAAGATPYNRLEDLQIGPDRKIYLAETGYQTAGDAYGRVLRFDPATNETEVWLEGDGTTMAQPDNLLFDPQGRLLICEDQFTSNLESHGSNELLRVAQDKAVTRLLAVRPDAEPSGPSWGPDGVLFLSVMAGPNSGLLAIRGL